MCVSSHCVWSITAAKTQRPRGIKVLVSQVPSLISHHHCEQAPEQPKSRVFHRQFNISMTFNEFCTLFFCKTFGMSGWWFGISQWQTNAINPKERNFHSDIAGRRKIVRHDLWKQPEAQVHALWMWSWQLYGVCLIWIHWAFDCMSLVSATRWVCTIWNNFTEG